MSFQNVRSGLIACSLFGLCLATPAGAQSDGDTAAGEKAFKTLCGLCHTVESGGRNKVGPNLHGLIGATAGQLEGYAYSASHRESGFVFDEAGLDTYIGNPKGTIDGTKKSIAGIVDAQKRANIIAFLRQATQ